MFGFHRCYYGNREDVREGVVTVGRGGQWHHLHWSSLMQSQPWISHLPTHKMDGMQYGANYFRRILFKKTALKLKLTKYFLNIA